MEKRLVIFLVCSALILTGQVLLMQVLSSSARPAAEQAAASRTARPPRAADRRSRPTARPAERDRRASRRADRADRRPPSPGRKLAEATPPTAHEPSAARSSPTMAHARVVRRRQPLSAAGHADQSRRRDRAGRTGGASPQRSTALSRSRRAITATWVCSVATPRMAVR